MVPKSALWHSSFVVRHGSFSVRQTHNSDYHNSMVPQPTVRMMQGWICQPMESGVVGFRRPTLMWEYPTPSPPLTATRHQQECTGRMNLRTSELTSSRYNRSNTLPSLPCSFATGGMGNEATIFTSARHHCSPRIGTSRTITRPDSFACMRQACMHWYVHAYQYYGIVIDKRSIVVIEPSRLVLKLQSWTKSYQKCST